jgi:hypothetical protein
MFFFVLAGLPGLAQAGITHRYSFNDGTANDLVGSANATLRNNATITGGKLVLDNDGINTSPLTGQYASLPQNILHTPNFALEVWITFDGGNPWQRIVDFGNSVPSGGQTYGSTGFLIFTMNSSMRPLGQLSINSWGGGHTDAIGGSSLTPDFPIGGEHQFVWVHSLTLGYEELFMDGASIGKLSAEEDPSTTTYSNFWIGRSQFSQDPFYNGSIDELRTYDNVLTPGDVLSNYRAGPNVVAVPEPGTLVLLIGSCALCCVVRSSRRLAGLFFRRRYFGCGTR